MKLDDLLRQNREWVKGTGPNYNIVMSSRTRLARNLDKFPFSNWANKKQLSEILAVVEGAVKSTNFLKDSLLVRVRDLSEVDRLFLVERHLMSLEHTKNPEYKTLVIDPK